jgi:DNA mismatch repair protein MutS2
MNLNAEGVITALSGDDAEVQAGALRLRIKVSELKRQEVTNDQLPVISKSTLPVTRHPSASLTCACGTGTGRTGLTLAPSPGLELDLRGQKAEDALSMLEDYLDRAFLAGLPFVRIIHGKGTGKLRQEVRAALKGHPHIKSFEEGEENEGGAGVTVAKIVSG